MYYYNSWTKPTIKRFIKKVNIDESNINDLGSILLFKLRAAERLGNDKIFAVSIIQKEFEEKIIEVYNDSLINNEEELDIKETDIAILNTTAVDKEKVLKYLREKVLLDNSKNNKLDLLKLVVEYLFINNLI